MDIEVTIRDYLAGILHMSFATCIENKPWVCEVHFVYDDDLNIYFRSKPSRRHSQEIAQNPNVAGNIVEQHGRTDKPRGIYFEGRAELINDADKEQMVYKLFQNRLGLGSEILEDAKQDDGHKFYRIIVTDYYLFDSRESSPSQKYHLPWKGNKNG